MSIAIGLLGLVIGFIAGFYYTSYRIAKDNNWVRLDEDESVCKKPLDGHILISVPPNVARRFIAANQEKDGEPEEARNVYRDKRQTIQVKKIDEE